MNTERSKQSVLYWILSLVIVIIALTILMRLTPSTKASATDSACTNINQQIETDQMGFRLPSGAKNVNIDCTVTDTNLNLKLRFDMSPAKLEAFLQKTAVKDWQTKAEASPAITYLDEPLISHMTAYLYADTGAETQHYLRILINISNIKRFSVYIECSMPV